LTNPTEKKIDNEKLKQVMQKFIESLSKDQLQRLFNESLNSIGDFFDGMKIYTDLSKAKQEIPYIWKNSSIEITFLDKILFQELNYLVMQGFEHNRQKVWDFSISWCLSDFVQSIRSLKKATPLKDMMKETGIRNKERKIIQDIASHSYNEEQVKVLMKECIDLVEIEDKLEKNVENTLNQSTIQLKHEYETRLRQIGDLYEGLRHEIGYLLYVLDTVHFQRVFSKKDYIDSNLGPNDGLYKFRKIWNDEKNRFIKKIEAKSLSWYLYSKQKKRYLPAFKDEFKRVMRKCKPIRLHFAHKTVEIEQNLIYRKQFRILLSNGSVKIMDFDEIDAILEDLIQFHSNFRRYLRFILYREKYEQETEIHSKMSFDKWIFTNTIFSFIEAEYYGKKIQDLCELDHNSSPLRDG